MENLKNAISLMTPNCLMASIDLKGAYYSVSVNKKSQKIPEIRLETPTFSVYLPPKRVNQRT